MTDWQVLPAQSFTNHAHAWDALNAAGPDSPLLHSGMIAAALAEFGSPAVRLAVGTENSRVQAMTLLTRRRFGVWQSFQPSQLPLGPWLMAAGQSFAGLLPALATALPGPVLRLGLSQQDPDFYPRPADDKSLTTLDYIPTARVRITEPFADYWQGRSRNLRHNLQRQRNRLDRDGDTPRLEILSQPTDMAAAITAYGQLEQAGWKAAQGTAVTAQTAQGRFYQTVLESFSQRGQAQVFRYWYGPRLVAADLCIRQGGTLVILKTAYDETLQGSSPAMLLRQDYFAQLFADPTLTVIEFYGRIMEWHTRFTAENRMLYHVNYTPWPARAIHSWFKLH